MASPLLQLQLLLFNGWNFFIRILKDDFQVKVISYWMFLKKKILLYLYKRYSVFILAALRRSKKRVRAVIATELPFLLSKEFSSGVENDLNATKISVDKFSKNSTANLHRERWSILFDQMDKALTEEEKQLVSIGRSSCYSFIILRNGIPDVFFHKVKYGRSHLCIFGLDNIRPYSPT